MTRASASKSISRRRAISVLAAGATLVAGGRAAAGLAERFVWTGTALGADARIILYHADRSVARAAIAACVDEIDRLENEFSLYRSDSALSRLNRNGHLAAPSHDMRRLLADAHRISAYSDGAFDITVQPLWQLYARHFAGRPRPTAGPDPAALAAALARIDYRRIDNAPARIRLAPGTAITLNGIGQGYITDRVADLLRRQGWSNLLVDLGEILALDDRPDGHPWAVDLPVPGDRAERLSIADRAVATSAGDGMAFDARGRHHHLFDPRTGQSANIYRSVTVVARRATVADALSTALYVMARPAAQRLARWAAADQVLLIDQNGRLDRLVG